MADHQKHTALVRPASGEWSRNELSVLGTDCGSIRQLAYAIMQSLSSFKIGYADADHKSAEAEQQSVLAISSCAYAEYTNKISFTRFDINTQPNTFQKRALFNDCDLVLINGNHFTSAKQIIVIDEKKPLEKKLEKLTHVQLILLKDSSSQIPAYIASHLQNNQTIPVLPFTDIEAIIHFIKQPLQQNIPLINGLVLSGGKSTRMGMDKGNIHYHDKSQREHVYQLLANFCNETFVSCTHEQIKSLTQSLPIIEDTFLGLGPLSGILSAFQRNPNTAWLSVACDLPYLHQSTIDYLINHRNPSKMATAFWDSEGKFPEPLVTLWEPRAYPVLLQFLSQGYSCPRKVLLNSDTEIVKAPDASAFKNVNTTEEYNEAIKVLHNKHNYC